MITPNDNCWKADFRDELARKIRAEARARRPRSKPIYNCWYCQTCLRVGWATICHTCGKPQKVRSL